VVKNTLAALATRRAGIEGLDNLLVGPTGMALGYEDVVAPAKVLDAFGKARREELPFKGGYLEGRLLSIDEVKELAALPSRDELVARLVGTMMGPIAGLHRVLGGNIRGLAIALSRIAEKKAGAA
jgi:large subunit ribosomal protein L10